MGSRKVQHRQQDRISKPVRHPENPGKQFFSSLTTLDPLKTFETFIPCETNGIAVAVAREVAKQSSGYCNPILLYGSVGAGKTHLLHAIANERAAGCSGLQVMLVTAKQFMAALIEAIRYKSLERFRRFYRQADLLLMDNLTDLAGKEATQDELLNLLDGMISEKKKMVITSQLPLQNLRDAEFDPRILSLISGGLCLKIHFPGKLTPKIVATKVGQMKVSLPEDTLELLARVTFHDYRELEGLLCRLHVLSSLTGETISCRMASNCLHDMGLLDGLASGEDS